MADFKTGFRGSETSSVEVVFYPQGDDPLFPTETRPIVCNGRTAESGAPAVVNLDLQFQLGAAAGNFSVVVKNLDNDAILDDDWVDITLLRHGQPHHKLRGIVDDVKPTHSIAGEGATSKSVTISGRSWGAIFEKTPLYYERLKGEFIDRDAITVFGAVNQNNLQPSSADIIVEAVLKTFLGAQNDSGRSMFTLPPGMQDRITRRIEAGGFAELQNALSAQLSARRTVVEQISFDTLSFDDEPQRVTQPQVFGSVGGDTMLWDIATAYSDPYFTELIPELRPAFGPTVTGERQMQVTFRTKPFMTTVDQDAWADLPMHILGFSDLTSHDVVRSGRDRFNAFFVMPQITQDDPFMDATVIGALLDEDSVKKHGMRKFEVQSRYFGANAQVTPLDFANAQREQLRDWNVLNPYFWTGSIGAARFVPEADVGQRLRILRESAEEVEDYYIEGIRHRWSLPQGGRTDFTVTRGWVGGDKSQLAAMEKLASRYVYVANV